MAKIIDGSYNCEIDGIFYWKGYYFKQGDTNFISGKWDDLKMNFINAEDYKNQILITVKCPKCRKIYRFYREK